MLIWKYKSDGTIDTIFNGDGIGAFDGTIAIPDVKDEWGNAIALDSTGNVYVSGRSSTLSVYFTSDMVIWKYK